MSLRRSIRNLLLGEDRVSMREELASMRRDLSLLVGQTACLSLPAKVASLSEVEFRVFSHYGEDGISQYLVSTVRPPSRTFVEFGVQTYLESNTRFLLLHNGWGGLVIDSEVAYINAIRRAPGYGWEFALRARHDEVTAENINDIFREEGIVGELGLLSVDIDGMDYHVWSALDVCRPAIVVIEYNSYMPALWTVTVPYEPSFDRTAKHQSNLYFGCSLGAAVHLGAAKGYRFVGVESHQGNAFFVREDLAGDLPRETPRPEQAVWSTPGRLTPIEGLPLLNVVTGEQEPLRLPR